LKKNSPYELLYKILPIYLNLKVFGSLCFASSLENNRNKLKPRARKCVFLGYKSGLKGYVLLDTKNRKNFINQNVIFPYKNSDDTSHVNQNYDTQNNTDLLLDFLVNENINFADIGKRLNNYGNRIFSVNENQDSNNRRDIENNNRREEETHNQESEVQEASHERTTNIDWRKSTKQRKIPSFLKDYHHQVNSSIFNEYDKNSFKNPISFIISFIV